LFDEVLDGVAAGLSGSAGEEDAHELSLRMPGQLVPTLAMLVPGHIEHWSQQLVLAINIPPMSESAAAKGADAVVKIRFTTSQITGGAPSCSPTGPP
jgi:uncharacterized protein YbjQ (UPF0145 family)